MMAKPGYVEGDYNIDGIPLGFPFLRSSVEKSLQFEFRPSDVLLVGYPKTGTAWLQEVLWLIANNADVDTARQEGVINRRVMRIEGSFGPNVAATDKLNQMESSPRLMNTHLPFKLIGKSIEKFKPKVIYMVRNPKDVVVSFYHFNKNKPGRGVPDFNMFFDMFMKGEHLYGDYFQHVKDWWKFQDDPSFLFLTFEEMKANPKTQMKRIAEFIGVAVSDEEISTIMTYTSFDKMKDRAKGGMGGGSAFFRKGEVGDWKNALSPQQSQQLDKKIETEFRNLDIPYKS